MGSMHEGFDNSEKYESYRALCNGYDLRKYTLLQHGNSISNVYSFSSILTHWQLSHNLASKYLEFLTEHPNCS